MNQIYIKVFCVIAFYFLISIYQFNLEILNTVQKLIKNKNVLRSVMSQKETEQEVLKLDVFDLKQNLLPKEIYDPIQCNRSALVIVDTMLCIHNPKNDIVSKTIMQFGIWEVSMLKDLLKHLKENPDVLFLDIGAQIGNF